MNNFHLWHGWCPGCKSLSLLSTRNTMTKTPVEFRSGSRSTWRQSRPWSAGQRFYVSAWRRRWRDRSQASRGRGTWCIAGESQSAPVWLQNTRHRITYTWFPGTGHSTPKRTWNGPSKLTQGHYRCYIYGRHFYATYWLSKLKRKWWRNSIFVVYNQYQLTIVGTHLWQKMVWSPSIATWRVYHLLQTVTSRFAALWQKYITTKYYCPFTKYCCLVLRLRNVAHK